MVFLIDDARIRALLKSTWQDQPDVDKISGSAARWKPLNGLLLSEGSSFPQISRAFGAPPSIRMQDPVMNAAAGDSRNTIEAAVSDSVPNRCSGTLLATSFWMWAVSFAS